MFEKEHQKSHGDAFICLFQVVVQFLWHRRSGQPDVTQTLQTLPNTRLLIEFKNHYIAQPNNSSYSNAKIVANNNQAKNSMQNSSFNTAALTICRSLVSCV
jgi:hypothetical protein